MPNQLSLIYLASSPDKEQPHPGNSQIPKVGRILSDDQMPAPRQSPPDAPLAYPGYGLAQIPDAAHAANLIPP